MLPSLVGTIYNPDRNCRDISQWNSFQTQQQNALRYCCTVDDASDATACEEREEGK